MAAESKDLFAFRRGFTDLLPNRSLDYARDDSLVRNLKQLDKLPICKMKSRQTVVCLLNCLTLYLITRTRKTPSLELRSSMTLWGAG